MSNGRLKTASFGPSFIGVILLFCGFAIVAWVLFRAAAPTQTYEEKRAEGRREKAAAIAKEAQDKLYSPVKWVDQSKGIVQLPIDLAMQLVANDYQAKPVQASSVKVETPYPGGLGQTGPASQMADMTNPGPPTPDASAEAAPSPAAAATPAAPAASPSPEVPK